MFKVAYGDPGFGQKLETSDPLHVEETTLNTEPHKLQISDIIYSDQLKNVTLNELKIEINDTAKTFSFFSSWSGPKINGLGSITKNDPKSYTKFKGNVFIDACK